MSTHDVIRILIAIAFESGPAQAGMAALRQQRSKTAEADVVLIKAIAATMALHKCGLTSGEAGGTPTIALSDAVQAGLVGLIGEAQAKKAKLAAAYGLDAAEVTAVEAYSSPNKDKATLTYAKTPTNTVTEPNPHYMGKAFGKFKNGWDALGSAMTKIPTLGDLGFTACTFRVARSSAESGKIERLAEDCRIVLGFKKMGMGQRHFASTSLTYSVHLTAEKVENANGMLALVGTSGVFINWLGVMSFGVDGCEVLYPPGVVMACWGTITGNGYKTKTGLTHRVHVLEEKEPSPADMASFTYVDDADFQVLTAKDHFAEIAGLRKTRFANVVGL